MPHDPSSGHVTQYSSGTRSSGAAARRRAQRQRRRSALGGPRGARRAPPQDAPGQPGYSSRRPMRANWPRALHLGPSLQQPGAHWCAQSRATRCARAADAMALAPPSSSDLARRDPAPAHRVAYGLPASRNLGLADDRRRNVAGPCVAGPTTTNFGQLPSALGFSTFSDRPSAAARTSSSVSLIGLPGPSTCSDRPSAAARTASSLSSTGRPMAVSPCSHHTYS
jgi:hypothetical protein